MIEKILNTDVSNDLLSRKIVDSIFYVHTQLGAGLLESVYEDCLEIILKKREISFEKQKFISIEFEDHIIEKAFRADFIIENQIILELKSVEQILSIHHAQLLSYMKLSNIKTGLLVNFNVKLIKDGIKRFTL